MTHDPHYATARELVMRAKKVRYYPYQVAFIADGMRVSYEVGWRDDDPILYRKEVVPLGGAPNVPEA